MTPRSKLLELIADLSFGREIGGQNRGWFVRLCFSVLNANHEGAPWCAAFVTLCLYLRTQGQPPFRCSDGVKELYDAAIAAGFGRSEPVAPGLAFVVGNAGTLDHVTFVVDTSDTTFTTAGGNEGNPAEAPTNNGFGVFWRVRPRTPNIYRFIGLEDL